MVNKSNRASIAVLALGHGVTDLYANFLPALLPVFQHNFSLSKSLVGMLIFALSISGSMCQVVYGYLGDRWGRRLFLVPGPAIAAVFMCFIGLSPSFAALFVLLIMGGMGVSAFHPHAASSVGDMAGSRRGFGLSVFMTGGTVGFAFGPMIAAALISSSYVGPARMPLAAVAGIVTSLLLYRYAIPEHRRQRTRDHINILQIFRLHTRPVTLLCMIVIFKATVSIVFSNFMSLLMDQRQLPLIIGGGAISLYLISNASGTLLGGYLYDKVSRKKLLIFTLLLASPLLFTLVHVKGAALVAALILSGVLMGCSNPAPLAIAQEMIPGGASTASSIMMGFSWGVAGLPVWFFGKLADIFGGDVVPAMSIASILPIIAAMFVLPLPKKQDSPAPEPLSH